jgi:hypothetical protein
MLYRIFTENKQKDGVAKVVTRFFDGFTLIEGEGYWQGKPEKTLIIEIDTINSTCPSNRISAIVDEIKELNNQQCCLVQETSLVRSYTQ